MVTVQSPSAPRVMSCTPPRRTCTLCASGADTRKATRWSGYTHGYGAPGMLSEEGLHSPAVCPQHVPQANSVKIRTDFMNAPLTPFFRAVFCKVFAVTT